MIRSRPFLLGASCGVLLVFIALVALVAGSSIGSGATNDGARPTSTHVQDAPSGALTTRPHVPIYDFDDPTWDPESRTCQPARTPDLDLGWVTGSNPIDPNVGDDTTLMLRNPISGGNDTIDAAVTTTVTTEHGDAITLRSQLQGAAAATVSVAPTESGPHTVIWEVDGVGFVACHGFMASDR